MSTRSTFARDAAAPLLLLAAIAAAALASADVCVAAGLTTGHWPALALDLPVRLLRDGPAIVLPAGHAGRAFAVVLGVLVGVELIAAAAVVVLVGRRGRPGDPRRSLIRRHDLDDLAGRRAAIRAQRLRPSLAPDAPRSERGIRLLRVDGRDV
jgi:hypothetical protein